MGAEDDIPAEVQAQVDAIKAEEGGAEPETEEVQLEHVEVEPRRSRKQQAEEERAAEFRAVKERAIAAEQLAQELRRENAERFARVEALLEANRQPQYIERPAAPAAPKDWRQVADKAQRKADEALARNDLPEYHKNLKKALRIEMEAEFNPRLEETQQRFQQQIPQQQFQKPPWVTSVENEFPDVVQHAAGLNAVAAFINLDSAPGFSPDKLKRAFERARQELKPAEQRQASTSQPTDRARQLLSGSQSSSGRGAPAGASHNGKPQVQVVKGFEQIARQAGMTPEEYKRAALAMQRNR